MRLPKDRDEWRELAIKAAPWVAGAVIVALSAGIIKAEHDKHERGAHPLLFWGRKKREQAGAAADEAKAAASRGWFGLRRQASHVGDKADGLWRDAKGAAKDKAAQAEKQASAAGSYIADKAGDLADASKHAAHHAGQSALKAGNKVAAAANSAEESTGKLLREAGKALEDDGRKAKQYHQAQEIKHSIKSKPWWRFW